MKTLLKYLLSKNNKPSISNGFPTEPWIDDIVNFLKENGFVEISDYTGWSYKDLDTKIKRTAAKKSVFSIEEKDKDRDWHVVSFMKKGSLSKENPLMRCICFNTDATIDYEKYFKDENITYDNNKNIAWGVHGKFRSGWVPPVNYFKDFAKFNEYVNKIYDLK